MISLNINMMTCQVQVWLFFIMSVFCLPLLFWCLCHSVTYISIIDVYDTFGKNVPVCLYGCRKRWQNQILSIFFVSIGFWVCIFNYFVKTTFCWVCVNVSLRFYLCYVLCVGGCWLIYHYLPSDWLWRLLWGSLIMARGLSLQSTG